MYHIVFIMILNLCFDTFLIINCLNIYNFIDMQKYNSSNINLKTVGKKITLEGFVQKSRRMGSLIFIDLRDIYGITQIIFSSNSKDYKLAEKLRSEYVIKVTGNVIKRKSINKNIKTGMIEIEGLDLVIYSKAKQTPLIIADKTDALESVRMKYRYLDLRRNTIKDKIIFRSKFMKFTRDFFYNNNFNEIETPILSKPTPEGARDFIVPSRLNPDKFFALPQSPQIYKQLLMSAGFEKYFQIAKVFRDEDSRKDRQIEFTQLDIEMSFVNQDEVMSLTEKYLKKLVKDLLNININEKFEIIDYDKAIDIYGTDRPDLRFDLRLNNGNDIFKNVKSDLISKQIKKGDSFRYIKLDQALSGKEHKELENYIKAIGGKGIMFFSYNASQKKYNGFLSKFLNDDIKKYFGTKNDFSILAILGEYYESSNLLGQLRNKLASLYLELKSELKFCWVTNWPLFIKNPDTNSPTSMHHPFTRPIDSEFYKSPKDIYNKKAYAYDIILNGIEIGGGSLRIYNKELQYEVFKILGLKEKQINDKFSYFINAFDYGMPPHGGIALGVDRIIQIVTNANSIRDVIAFPKSTSGYSEMEEAPTNIEDKIKKDLGIN